MSRTCLFGTGSGFSYPLQCFNNPFEGCYCSAAQMKDNHILWRDASFFFMVAREYSKKIRFTLTGIEPPMTFSNAQ